jgi:hypothetical protein
MIPPTRNLKVGPDGRVRNERFSEGYERDVQRARSFVDWTGLLETDSEILDQFDEIVDCLLEGNLVPEKYYRHRIEHSPDPLLAAEGIKHLHLGGRNSDVILYLVEYPDRIVLLEIGDHRHFASKPEGSLLKQLHHSCLRAEDADAALRKAERVTAIRAGLRDRAKPSDPA